MSLKRLLSLALTCASVLAFGHASAQETTSEKLWRSYANEMASFIGGGDTKVDGLQLVSVAQVADWDQDAHADYNRDVKWCDQIPKFGPMFDDSGRKVSEAYGLYIESLRLPSVDPVKEKQVDQARSDWKKALTAENNISEKVGVAWTKFDATQAGIPANRRKSYDTWFAANYGQQVGSARTTLTGKAQTYAQLLAVTYQGYGEVTNAILDYANTAYQLESTAPNSLTLAHRTCSASPSLKDFVDRGKQNAAAGAFAHSLTISTSHKELHASDWSASAGGSFLGFISVGGNGGVSHHEVHNSGTAFLVDIKFRNLEIISFQRAPWFHATVISLLHDNGDFVPGAVVNADKLWGPKGIFELLPVAAVVAYQPTITVTLDETDYKDVQNQWNVGASVGYGPFVISGKGHGSNEDTVWDDAKHSLTTTFKTETPYVIAVKNIVMPGL